MPNVVENRAKRKLKEGKIVLSLSVNQMRTANIGLVAAACGYDAIYCDLEHNPTSLESAAMICIATLPTGVTPLCRVTSKHPHDIARVLDCGAQGVMVPHVDTVAEAKSVVEAVRFAPIGHRSAFAPVPALGYASHPQGDLHRILNDETLLIVMLETPQAVENVDAIAALEGIDVVHIGSTDLSTEMGIPGDYNHARRRAAYEKVAAAAKKHGKQMGVGGVRNDPEYLTWLVSIGVQYLSGASDLGFILNGGKADVEAMRKIAVPKRG
jgi:2-keto-3-deoxy-L-rhamnonate aldolase RhmA